MVHNVFVTILDGMQLYDSTIFHNRSDYNLGLYHFVDSVRAGILKP
jgi:hypothetical protein